MMRSTGTAAALGATALVALLAACGSSGSGGSSASGAAPGATSSAATSGAALSVVKSSLGAVVAGPDGRTVYMFAKDTKDSGKSTCTGPCLTNWPPVIVAGAPKASGITGKVGTITTEDGKKQATLGGWPLYYFKGDGAAGDVTGQGINAFGGLWWALSPSGSEVTTSASAGSSSAGGYGSKGGAY